MQPEISVGHSEKLFEDVVAPIEASGRMMEVEVVL
jgi:hypothetical protein